MQALYLLALARNFTPAHHDLLVSQLGSLEALLTLDEQALKKIQLPDGHRRRLRDVLRDCDPASELATLTDQDVHLVGWGSASYPALLATIADAPLLLFGKGDVSLLQHDGIAIVGSRKCSERGRELAQQFGRELAELGLAVVSGMALGIDGAAHEGALSAGGATIAVLGCGVDVVYPPRHQQLYEQLCAQGLVLSEYPQGTEPRKEHFPQRNRIISGLSKGTVVVEAPLGSGALITAHLALEQGREVFAVPGPVASHFVKGCNYLIKNGQAKLIEGVDDILAEFGENRASLRRTRLAPASAAAAAGTKPAAASTGPAPDALAPEEQRVLEVLSYEGTHVNEVVHKLGITTAECIAHLTMLQIKGLITSATGGYYARL